MYETNFNDFVFDNITGFFSIFLNPKESFRLTLFSNIETCCGYTFLDCDCEIVCGFFGISFSV